jgi:sec-independent protein translocase protein TatB
MLGIGLPEMIVILAVALIVVGPDKLPDMARSIAKWVFELKKTVNQVKESLADEENLLGSVQSDLRKTGNELKGKLRESDHFTWHEPGGPKNGTGGEQDEVIDMDLQQTNEPARKEAAGPDGDGPAATAADPEPERGPEDSPEKPSP